MKISQEGARVGLKMATRWSHEGPKVDSTWAGNVSRRDGESSPGGSSWPKMGERWPKTLEGDARGLQESLRAAQDGPKMSQDGPNVAPQETRECPG